MDYLIKRKWINLMKLSNSGITERQRALIDNEILYLRVLSTSHQLHIVEED